MSIYIDDKYIGACVCVFGVDVSWNSSKSVKATYIEHKASSGAGQSIYRAKHSHCDSVIGCQDKVLNIRTPPPPPPPETSRTAVVFGI